ncbi:MAG TPA: hypothetical protein VNK43_01870 [Gemmatimonadales bacterium]|nr:hypothetical protein [Gemmatimonadales bacterium]
MDPDILDFFGVMLAIFGAGGIGVAVVSLSLAVAKRLQGGGRPDAEVLTELLRLRAELDELQGLRGRVAELEERLDYAERMLARGREPERLVGKERAT